ncbi:unnamed protein product [Darwinula stevensoni]|uniref:Uncharacterized protein n=1 Tax=Darwinula stevensoni TaxID=69355 RepID=A0A7R8XE63_9CRUS|nr:unnamed protein product [Darwinula stevensoni]CAG0893943.1 unnamed protein product [Darwinula stevensoni]
MVNNENVTEFHEGFFGALSFESIFVNHTAVKNVSPSAILPLRDQIEKLEISFSQLEGFPFHSLLSFPRLSDLRLERNSLTLVSAIQSKSLEILSLAANPLEKIPADLVTSMTNLKEFHCVACKLGPTLRSQMLAFASKQLLRVDLQGNEISKIERLAITGLMPETELIMDGNQITELPKEVFRPLLMYKSHAEGYISLQGNPIECNCRLAWFIHEPHLIGSVRGTCENGTAFANVTLQCVEREEADLCTPGSNKEHNPRNAAPTENKSRESSKGTKQFTTTNLISWAYQIAQGMEFLGSRKHYQEMTEQQNQKTNPEYFQTNKDYLQGNHDPQAQEEPMVNANMTDTNDPISANEELRQVGTESATISSVRIDHGHGYERGPTKDTNSPFHVRDELKPIAQKAANVLHK